MKWSEGERGYMDQDDAKEMVLLIMEHLDKWPIKSAESFRNAILGSGLIAVNPMLDFHEQKGFTLLNDAMKQTIQEGRMIDFGYIPNDIIKLESTRARDMFEAHEFQHPYDNWLAVTSWEGGCNGYYISCPPIFKGETLVVELYGVSIPNIVDAILIYDIVSIKVEGFGQTIVSPSNLQNIVSRFDHPHLDPHSRGANSLDPLVTMLRLLHDASIPIEHREAPEKLNKVRTKQGKFQIPSHTVVRTKDYVANFHAPVAASKTGKGGSHASPISHWRRSHQRHLATGKVVTVKSTKVNWRDSSELHRLFYKVTK